MFHGYTSTRNASISSQNSALIDISNYRAIFSAPAVKGLDARSNKREAGRADRAGRRLVLGNWAVVSGCGRGRGAHLPLRSFSCGNDFSAAGRATKQCYSCFDGSASSVCRFRIQGSASCDCTFQACSGLPEVKNGQHSIGQGRR